MKKDVAVFPGSFDPFTRAHEELLREASRFFKVVVLICVNPNKGGGMFSIEERKTMILNHIVENNECIGVDVCTGITTEYCRLHKINYIIRGIQYKNAAEELDLSHIYYEENGIKTVFFPTYDRDYENVSSTRVRAYINYNVQNEGHGLYLWKNYVPTRNREYIMRWIERKIENV